MDEHKREPLTDDQLSALLKKWDVTAPAELESRVIRARADAAALKQRRSWWSFLLKGSIRVPVPVACCLAILMIVVVWREAKVAVTCAAAISAPVQAVHTIGACPANSKC